MLSQMDDVEIIGITDRNISKVSQVAKEYGLNYSKDFRDFLDKATTFFVVTPTNTHFEIALELIKNKKNIFIEKPLTENLEQAIYLLDEAIKGGNIFQVGLIERFNPVINTLKENLKNPHHISTQRVSPFLGRAIDTHVTFDLMIHDLDLIFYILGRTSSHKVQDLKVFKKSLITNKIDLATAWLFLSVNERSVIANLLASRVGPDFQRNISIVDEDSILYADLIKKTIIKIDKMGKAIEIPVKNIDLHPLYEEIRDFLDSIKRRRLSKQAPSPTEIIEVIKLINQINRGNIDETIH
jgi:predicted dehydrogenase